MAAQPTDGAVRTKNLLLTMRRCVLHSSPIAVEQQMNALVAERGRLLNRIEELSAIEQFTPAISDQLERASARRAQITGMQTLSGRIQNAFMCHLLRAPLLEVNDEVTAQIVSWLFVYGAWRGVACFTHTFPNRVKDAIILSLGPVPHRIYRREGDVNTYENVIQPQNHNRSS